MADDRDDAAARLDRRVAEAADAWLTDPRDTGVYARLVAAVTERRGVLDAALRVGEADGVGGAGEPDEAAAPAAAAGAPADEAPDDDPDADPDDDPDDEPAVPLRPVGADLVGDPRAVLDRLRRG